MATQLFLRTDAGPSVAGFAVDVLLSASRGAAASFIQTNTSSGGDHVEMGGASNRVWAIQVEAVTISGTITFNLRMYETAMQINAQCACRVARFDSAGTFVSDVVANANANHGTGTEMSTSEAARNWTATPTSTAFSAGDILAVIPHGDAIGTMGAGSPGLGFWYAGPTAGASGDSYVTFTETITEFVPPSWSVEKGAGTFQPPDLSEQLTDDPRMLARRPWYRRGRFLLPVPGLFVPALARA